MFPLFLALALWLPLKASAGEWRAVDDRRVSVVLSAPAQRIVTLAPSLAELVFAAGAGEKLVGVSAWSDFPAAVKTLPQIGNYGKIDMERLLQLRPDLVIAWRSGNAPGDLAHLERLGIHLYVSEAQHLDDIARHITAIGQLAGSAALAERAAAAFRGELRELERRYADARPVTAFYQLWHQPLMTVNVRHLIGEALLLCGGTNPYAALSALTPTVSLESLLAADPVAIIGGDTADWLRYPQLQAVRHNRLFTVHPDLLQRATPRMLEGVRQMCAALRQARR